MHITQTAVTARIRNLEDQLQCQLFVRNRSGARLTNEGERFVEYATTLVQTWSLAKNHLSLPSGSTERVRLGAETSLWNPLMINWISWTRKNMPAIAIDSVVDNASHLISNLQRGSLDAAVLHRPNYYSGFTVEQVLEEKLIHVEVPGKTEPFLYIHWGEDFRRQFDAVLPNKRQSIYTFNLGQHALQMMLKNGGNGWYRTRVVEPYLRSGQLERVTGSPEFTYPIYLCLHSSNRSKALAPLVTGLKETLTDKKLTIV